ncbi:unnamed protein product, partial [Polarella glacialis]
AGQMGGQLCKHICKRPSESVDAVDAPSHSRPQDIPVAGNVADVVKPTAAVKEVVKPTAAVKEDRNSMYASAQAASQAVETSASASRAGAWKTCEETWAAALQQAVDAGDLVKVTGR